MVACLLLQQRGQLLADAAQWITRVVGAAEQDAAFDGHGDESRQVRRPLRLVAAGNQLGGQGLLQPVKGLAAGQVEPWVATSTGMARLGTAYTGASVPAKISQASTVLASRLRMI